MKRVSFADMNCSLAQALEQVGEWWTLLILRDASFGVTRFDDFHERLGISRNILTVRLDSLVVNGILERRLYDAARDRHDYVLTDKGKALWKALSALREWGDEWILGHGHEPIQLVHRGCGGEVRVQMVCTECGATLERHEARSIPGPGLHDAQLLQRPR